MFFQQLFRGVLARQVEYSYSEAEDSFTTMVPIERDLLPQVIELAKTMPFAGQWAWSVERFASAMQPDEFLFRLDWLRNEPTLTCWYEAAAPFPVFAELRRARC